MRQAPRPRHGNRQMGGDGPERYQHLRVGAVTPVAEGRKGSGVFDIDRSGEGVIFFAHATTIAGLESGGYAYHVLNRAVGRARIFGKKRDYEVFEEVLAEEKNACPCGCWLGA